MSYLSIPFFIWCVKRRWSTVFHTAVVDHLVLELFINSVKYFWIENIFPHLADVQHIVKHSLVHRRIVEVIQNLKK